MFEGGLITSNNVLQSSNDVLWSTISAIPNAIPDAFPDAFSTIPNDILNDILNTTPIQFISKSPPGQKVGFVNCTNPVRQDEPPDEVFVRPFDLSMGVTAVVLGLIILFTILGNVFVIAAILLEKSLQNVANYLIISLAFADLLVACLVMPLGAIYQLMRSWTLGPEVCNIWTFCDVLCCTASILHLLAIAVDRFFAVTSVHYNRTRDWFKMIAMIIMVWSMAVFVALAPNLGWKDPHHMDRLIRERKCLVNQDLGYQVFATCATFYVPLLIMLFLYWKIFQTAKKRIRKNQISKHSSKTESVTPSENASLLPKWKLRSFKGTGQQSNMTNITKCFSTTTDDEKSFDTVVGDGPRIKERTEEKKRQEFGGGEMSTTFTISSETGKATSTNNLSPEKSSEGVTTNNGSANHQSHISDFSRIEIVQPNREGEIEYGTATATEKADPMQLYREKKESLEAKRERKAAKTLAIITGAFVVCWLPFFMMALLTALFGPISDDLSSFFLWLGYFNSTLNPIIYTVFSPEFRQAFKRILFGRSPQNPHNQPGKRSAESGGGASVNRYKTVTRNSSLSKDTRKDLNPGDVNNKSDFLSCC